MDAMSETMAMCYGKPVKVFADQAHDAHIAIHDIGAQQIIAQLPTPEAQQMALLRMRRPWLG